MRPLPIGDSVGPSGSPASCESLTATAVSGKPRLRSASHSSIAVGVNGFGTVPPNAAGPVLTSNASTRSQSVSASE